MNTYVEMARGLANYGMVSKNSVLVEAAFLFLDLDEKKDDSRQAARDAYNQAMVIRSLYNKHYIGIIQARAA